LRAAKRRFADLRLRFRQILFFILRAAHLHESHREFCAHTFILSRTFFFSVSVSSANLCVSLLFVLPRHTSLATFFLLRVHYGYKFSYLCYSAFISFCQEL